VPPHEPSEAAEGIISTRCRVRLLGNENLEWELRQCARGHDEQLLVLDYVLNLTEQRLVQRVSMVAVEGQRLAALVIGLGVAGLEQLRATQAC
jgi:hypothetical protein